MTHITITSTNKNERETVNHILSGALERERKILLAAIEKTRLALTNFEKKYSMDSIQFFKLYQDGKMDESEENLDWSGEYQIYLNLKNKLDSIEGIKVAH